MMRKANVVILGTLVVTAAVVIFVAQAVAGMGGVAAVILTTLSAALSLIGPGANSGEPETERASRDPSKRHAETTYYYDDGSSSDDPVDGSDASSEVDRQ